ncbi:hypothetical protein K491DRAFT_713581 [Lophiostoma macrostomum CBS 122681]|uniref:Nucleoporin NUP53 n=1 Tax=Lophiostoma macrostomum CBS 122681 TaxID=1314788 RepID=A0A6A6TGQ5_9PLEO|nr:hypothetical protein K491DRAFT_713581 [Lophiostoma macrostomum CBS 122681]
MQVHAVPDSDRAFDSTGRKLPWGYEYADATQPQRRVPEERGPFGKRRARGTSRSKTATPARKEDQASIENLRFVDSLFEQTKKQEERKRESLRVRNASASLPISASAPNLGEGAALGSSFQAGASTAVAKEPTEILLYGYGNEVQWAAIDYYEKVSNGIIYEDYDRQPPNTRFDFSLSNQRAHSYRSLHKASLRKVNEYVGGNHWIKVTFDSPEAAERACHYSPHVIQGFTVYAERYRGTGPSQGDVPIRALAGSQGASQTASPNTVSSTTLRYGESSATVSSATATGSMPASLIPPRMASEPFLRGSGAFPIDDLDSPTETLVPQSQTAQPVATGAATSLQQQPQEHNRNTLRIRGAKPIKLLPQEKAFLPAPPLWQQTLASMPIIGWVVGSNQGMIGDQVPRKEDGTFDRQNATLYWRAWYAVDSCLGTDFCGVRDAEYDD